MTLSVHVGALSPFFAAALERVARSEDRDPPTGAQVTDRVIAWREWVFDGLVTNGHLAAAPDWPEAPDAEHEQVHLADIALRALKLRLSYDGHGPAPSEVPAQPDADPRWTELAESDFQGSAFDQVLVPEFWLPGEFAFTFACPYPDGHEVPAGSLGALYAQLTEALTRVFEGTPVEWSLWAADCEGTDVDGLARHAAAQLHRLAARAIDRGVPMLLFS